MLGCDLSGYVALDGSTAERGLFEEEEDEEKTKTPQSVPVDKHLFDARTVLITGTITQELAREQGLSVDEEDFAERFRQHQLKSQAGAEQRFKGVITRTSGRSFGSTWVNLGHSDAVAFEEYAARCGESRAALGPVRAIGLQSMVDMGRNQPHMIG